MVLGVKLDLAVGKVDRYLIEDVVIIQLAEARDCSIDGRLISGDFLLLFGQLRPVRFQFSIRFRLLLGVLLDFLLAFVHARLDSLGLRQIVTFAVNPLGIKNEICSPYPSLNWKVPNRVPSFVVK